MDSDITAFCYKDIRFVKVDDDLVPQATDYDPALSFSVDMLFKDLVEL